MNFVKSLKSLSRKDVISAGGKGASLGELIRSGISVPPGFVILSNAFEFFLKQTNLHAEIKRIVRCVDTAKMNTLEDASEAIMALVTRAEMPTEIAMEIMRHYRHLGALRVAVRSSATAEDSATSAWAGQLESEMNVAEADLLKSVKRCWASLYTPRAIFYRLENGLKERSIGVGVVIQKMVQSEVSGVAFSVHPVTQDAQELLIEAGLGFGEAIVSGRITPDAYVVDKERLDILEKRISRQEKAIGFHEHRGYVWKKVERRIGSEQKLTDREIRKLADLVRKIERHGGFPIDVEWAMEKGGFYLTQSRPITTLKKESGTKQGLMEYVKNQRWFFGIRAKESLFFYSAKKSESAYLKKMYGIGFAESIFVSRGNDYPVRIYNVLQAERFHAVSKKKISVSLNALTACIEKNDALYRRIDFIGRRLLRVLKRDRLREIVAIYRKLLEAYEIACSQFLVIYSLGLQLASSEKKTKKANEALRRHDVWRNSLVFKEEVMGEQLFFFFRYLIEKKNLKMRPLELMNSLTVTEIDDWLSGKIFDQDIVARVLSRLRNGFVYVDLRNGVTGVLDNRANAADVRRYVSFLKKVEQTRSRKDVLQGSVACASERALTGSVLIIRDKVELEKRHALIKDKILVAIQTTPHFIPYLQGVKAIVTDEGGLTCHAAIVARESGIPCIVGTKTATRILKNGDHVELDFQSGTIRKI